MSINVRLVRNRDETIEDHYRKGPFIEINVINNFTPAFEKAIQKLQNGVFITLPQHKETK